MAATSTAIPNGATGVPSAAEIKQGVQATAEAYSSAAVRLFDALATYYLDCYDLAIQAQGQWGAATKQLLDQAAQAQQSGRQLTAQLIQSNRAAQHALLESGLATAKAYQAAWLPTELR